MKKENAPRKSSERKQSHSQDISAQAQRQRLLIALRKGSITTQQARSKIDVLHPAGRVQELRAEGYNIVTHWQSIIDL